MATRGKLLFLARRDDDVPATAPHPSDFHALFRRYAPYVIRIGQRVLGRDDEIDDLVQDVFLLALRHVSQLRRNESFRDWLGRIAVRRALAIVRWRRVRQSFGAFDEADYETIARADASPEERVAVARLYRELDRLPANDRVAWCLRYLEGAELTEVATLCGCSLATAKRRIAAAQVRLKGVVDDARAP